jgi:nucleotide-binding universal stress UspA family protein
MPVVLEPKSIIVHLPAAGAAERLMDMAAALARRFGARLTGLHVVPHIPLYVDAGMGVGADFYTAQQQALHEEADRTQEVFARRLDSDGLEGDWVRLSGEDRPAMQVAIAFCRPADLVIASQYDETMPGGAAYFPEDLVLGAGRPVVLVPRQGVAPSSFFSIRSWKLVSSWRVAPHRTHTKGAFISPGSCRQWCVQSVIWAPSAVVFLPTTRHFPDSLESIRPSFS